MDKDLEKEKYVNYFADILLNHLIRYKPESELSIKFIMERAKITTETYLCYKKKTGNVDSAFEKAVLILLSGYYVDEIHL